MKGFRKVVAILWILQATNVVSAESVSKIFGFESVNGGYSLFSYLAINWSEGYAIQYQRDYQLPLKVCPEASRYYCIVVGGSHLVFALPINPSLWETDWYFFGRHFHVENVSAIQEESILVIESELSDSFEQSADKPNKYVKTIFWYSTKKGLLGYQFLPSPVSTNNGSTTWLVQDGGLSMHDLELRVPEKLLFDKIELTKVLSPSAGRELKHILYPE